MDWKDWNKDWKTNYSDKSFKTSLICKYECGEQSGKSKKTISDKKRKEKKARTKVQIMQQKKVY